MHALDENFPKRVVKPPRGDTPAFRICGEHERRVFRADVRTGERRCRHERECRNVLHFRVCHEKLAGFFLSDAAAELHGLVRIDQFFDVRLMEPHNLDRSGVVFNRCLRHRDFFSERLRRFDARDSAVDNSFVSRCELSDFLYLRSTLVPSGEVEEKVVDGHKTELLKRFFLGRKQAKYVLNVCFFRYCMCPSHDMSSVYNKKTVAETSVFLWQALALRAFNFLSSKKVRLPRWQ